MLKIEGFGLLILYAEKCSYQLHQILAMVFLICLNLSGL